MSENRKFSVLMSVYVKENPVFLEEAVESIIHQTLKPSEVVIVEDGPLTPELYQVLEKLEGTVKYSNQNVALLSKIAA